MGTRSRDPLIRVRSICLALPESTEKEAWGAPTFRVRDKMFLMYVDDHHGDGRVAVWCKAPPGDQELFVAADATRFFVPPYVGHKGWIGVCLGRGVDWEAIAEIAQEGHRMTAPKRLAGLLDALPSRRSRPERRHTHAQAGPARPPVREEDAW